jgi:hypothetical protein
MDVDSEGWYGRPVRTGDGTVVGIVVGVFADGPLAGRLRVHGACTVTRRQTGPPDAIPHRTVVRRG